MDYLFEAGKGVREGATLVADRVTLGKVDSLHAEAEALRARGGLYTWADISAAIATEAGEALLTGGAGKMLAAAAKTNTWIGRGAKLLMEGQKWYDRVNTIQDLYELEQLLETIVDKIDEFVDNAVKKEGISEDQAIETFIDMLLDMVGGNCFVAGTPVSTEHGLRPIESVRVGDRVWSFNHRTGGWELKPVLRLFRNDYDGELFTLTVAGTSLTATAGHPFWVLDGVNLLARPPPDHGPASEPGARRPGRWVNAADLRVGDVVLLRDGRAERITRIDVRRERTTVYNFHVADLHNYAAGSAEVLVHNTSRATRAALKAAKPKLTQKTKALRGSKVKTEPIPIRNAHLAGKTHPVTGIPFDSKGFPDFSGVSKKDVKISFTGNRNADFAAANSKAGFGKSHTDTPSGYTWHHHQDGKTMQLVPTDIHSKTGHTGGFSLHRKQ
jgi:hypothetical protein